MSTLEKKVLLKQKNSLYIIEFPNKIIDHGSECSLALVLCVRGSAQKLLAPFSRQRVFLLKDSGFIRSSRVTDASWLRLVPSLLHKHLRYCNLNHTSIGHLWHPLFDNLFVMTMFSSVFLPGLISTKGLADLIMMVLNP